MKNTNKLLAFVLSIGLLVGAGLAYAQYSRVQQENQTFTGSVTMTGTNTISGATTLSGGATLSGTNTLSGATTLSGTTTISGALTVSNTAALNETVTVGNELLCTADAVALTSPTVTFAPADHFIVSLTSDANQTGIYPTAGKSGQILIVVSGAGSNTMRFDDGANTIIGGNVTLTEGQSDVLILWYSGSAWVGLAAHDN